MQIIWTYTWNWHLKLKCSWIFWCCSLQTQVQPKIILFLPADQHQFLPHFLSRHWCYGEACCSCFLLTVGLIMGDLLCEEPVLLLFVSNSSGHIPGHSIAWILPSQWSNINFLWIRASILFQLKSWQFKFPGFLLPHHSPIRSQYHPIPLCLCLQNSLPPPPLMIKILVVCALWMSLLPQFIYVLIVQLGEGF